MSGSAAPGTLFGGGCGTFFWVCASVCDLHGAMVLQADVMSGVSSFMATHVTRGLFPTLWEDDRDE